MTLVEGMIRTGRFNHFVNELVKIRNEELDDKTKWEFWLHRVFNMNYGEFIEATTEKSTDDAGQVMSQAALEATLKDSMEIANGFQLS